MSEKMGQRKQGPRDEEAGNEAEPSENGSCIAVYIRHGEAGRPTLDFIWWSGLLVTAVQLGVAAIPLAMRRNWSILLVASTGTLLAYASASLPHWREEKYKARRKEMKRDFALTRGQGSRHVLIVLCARRGENETPWGLNLADLAGARAPNMPNTRIWATLLATLWMVFLITCTGIVSDTWYLLAVGGLGMLHNLLSAGWPRRIEAMGLPIELEDQTQIFAETKVMWALMELELKHAGFGKALLREFFPGPLWGWEEKWWRNDGLDRRAVLDAQKRE